ncbi:MAG: hypothetical protein PHO02_05245 [Candidatus Nanoarchaeia archaeon]|nr:hypothetical protein [Candidatus Nanoarchaeia archaeon]
MKKIELERLISKRKKEAQDKGLLEKAVLVVRDIGRATKGYQDYDGYGYAGYVNTEWCFEHDGFKLSKSINFGTSYRYDLLIISDSKAVFFAKYGSSRTSCHEIENKEKELDAKKLSEFIVLPVFNTRIYSQRLEPVQICQYLPGNWEDMLNTYAADPKGAMKRIAEEQRQKQYDESPEAGSSDLETALNNFGIKRRGK